MNIIESIKKQKVYKFIKIYSNLFSRGAIIFLDLFMLKINIVKKNEPRNITAGCNSKTIEMEDQDLSKKIFLISYINSSLLKHVIFRRKKNDINFLNFYIMSESYSKCIDFQEKWYMLNSNFLKKNNTRVSFKNNIKDNI